jgi:hypothetical protein
VLCAPPGTALFVLPPCLQLPQGSGPWGLLLPGDVAGLLASLQNTLTTAGPQLQALLQQPGAGELASDVSRQLAQRFAARVVKFTFGMTAARSGAAAAAAAAASDARR